MSTVDSAEIRVVPANEASWDDLQAVFGARGYPSQCQCQRIRLGDRDWWDMPVEERAALLHEQTSCGDPDAPATSGLVAYVDGEPAGWVAVAPRTEYRRYRNSSVPWAGRHEDKDDDSVWAIVCFVVRAGFRGRGLTYDLAQAAVEHARSQGAGAVEGYPIVAPPGKVITWGETNVGTPGPFAAAGLEEVSSPTLRRRVMRLDL